MPRHKKPSLKKRNDGRFKCKYHGKQFYSTISPEDAYAKMEEYKRLESAGITKKATVTDYALPWLIRTYPSVSKSTKTGLAIHLQHLIDGIGEYKISDVKPSDIKNIYAAQYKGLSNSYIKSAKQLYCSLFDSAVADGLCRFNPARDKTAKPHKGKKPKDRILTNQQRIWIETLCTNHRAYPAVMAMLYAGIRPQEMKAIDIDRDVDFQNDTITVQETAHLDGWGYNYNEEMKTEWSKRVIPLFPPLKKALSGKHGYIITSVKGERVTIQAWKSAWESYISCMETAINGIQKRWYGKTKEQKKLKDEGKLNPWIEFDIVPYTLRHAFCQMCRDANPQVDINTCRRWMGHADSKMILQVYDSVSENRSDQERKKIENWLIGVQNGVQNKKANPVGIENKASEDH